MKRRDRSPTPPPFPPGQITVVLALVASVLVDRSVSLDDRGRLYVYGGIIALATLVAIVLDIVLPYRRSRA